ncbi:MAG: hypothetical protein ACI31S_01465 [Bacilli bacterium]
MKLFEFENLVKELNKNKYHISRSIEFDDKGEPYISEWSIYNKEMPIEEYYKSSNIAILSSENGNTIKDIEDLIKKNNDYDKIKKDEIINELIDLGIKLNGDSINYWTELLFEIYKGKFERFSIQSFYLYLAEKYNKTWTAVERILRYGTKQMEKRIREKYNIKTKITNETIIKLFQLKIF